MLCCSPAPLPSAATSSTSSSQLVEANLSLKVTAVGPCTPGIGMGGLGGGSPLSHPAGFKRKETRGKLAIGITTNFINRHSRAEVEVAEISGVARIYNQKFFQNLYNKTGWWSWPRHGGCWGSLPFLVQLEGQPQGVPSVMGCMSPHGTPLQGTFGG